MYAFLAHFHTCNKSLVDFESTMRSQQVILSVEIFQYKVVQSVEMFQYKMILSLAPRPSLEKRHIEI
jgi:hypothetical protein